MPQPPAEYVIRCPRCLADHDAVQAIWCSCDPQNPTKLCPFCLDCFCTADEGFREAFWRDAPPSLIEERQALKGSRLLLGDMLVRAGVITTDQLLQALVRQREQGGRVGDALVALGFLTKERIDEFVRVQHPVVAFEIHPAMLDHALVRQVGLEFCRQRRILPLERESFQNRNVLTLAMADPADAETINQVQRISGCQVVAGRAPEDSILAGLDGCGPGPAPAAVADPGPPPPADAGEAPEPAGFLDRLLHTGLERGADELQLLEDGTGLLARFRIGDRVFRASCPPGTEVEATLAELRRRLGEDGRLRFAFGGGELELGVEELGEGSGVRIRFGV